MKNKFKKVKKFIFETFITFIPFTVSYLILGNWVSNVVNFSRKYKSDPNLSNEVIIFFRGIDDNGAFTVSHMLASRIP